MWTGLLWACAMESWRARGDQRWGSISESFIYDLDFYIFHSPPPPHPQAFAPSASRGCGQTGGTCSPSPNTRPNTNPICPLGIKRPRTEATRPLCQSPPTSFRPRMVLPPRLETERARRGAGLRSGRAHVGAALSRPRTVHPPSTQFPASPHPTPTLSQSRGPPWDAWVPRPTPPLSGSRKSTLGTQTAADSKVSGELSRVCRARARVQGPGRRPRPSDTRGWW